MGEHTQQIADLNKFGQRAAFGVILHRMMKNDPKLVVCVADTSTSGGLDRCRRDYPERIIELGIGEQNLIGVAAGLQAEGWTTIAATFAPFITLRCLEQLKIFGGYNKIPLKIVGYASGLALAELGYTHCGLDDVGVLRAIGSFDVLAPADCNALPSLLDIFVSATRPTYLRLTGIAPSPALYSPGAILGVHNSEKSDELEFRKYNILKEGDAAVVVTSGTIASSVLSAVNILSDSDKIEVKVIDLYHLTVDIPNSLVDELKDYSKIICVEEHRRRGGIGDFLRDGLSARGGVDARFFHLAVSDDYKHYNSYSSAVSGNSLDEAGVTNFIRRAINEV